MKIALLVLAVACAALAVPTISASVDCTPVSDPGAREVDSPALTIYVQSHSVPAAAGHSAPMVSHVWKETNGIPGLQESPDLACGGPADMDWIATGL